MSFPCYLDKVFISLRQRFDDGFRFNWPIEMLQLWEAELSTSSLTATCILSGLLQSRDTIRKLSKRSYKLIKKLCPRDNGTTRSIVKRFLQVGKV